VASQILVDFASQIQFSNHYYVGKQGDSFVLTKEKASNQHLLDLINAAQAESRGTKEVALAVKMIRTHLEKKISGLYYYIVSGKDYDKIRTMIDALPNLEATDRPQNEAEARLLFYKNLPGSLRVKNAAQKDLETIKIVSTRLWNHFQNYDSYADHMKLFFEGEHFLFEEAENFTLYDTLKDTETTGAYLRGSSHYDHGTLDGKTGGPVPKSAGDVANPQYEIEGPQIKALLVGRVKLALKDDNTLIFGKSFDQIREEKGNQAPARSKNYTFMQAEWAPDSDSYLSANFWKHRVLSFILYAGRKFIGSSTPNVGPYGYGHGDQKCPTVIKA
jgi:hypothetical protein